MFSDSLRRASFIKDAIWNNRKLMIGILILCIAGTYYETFGVDEFLRNYTGQPCVLDLIIEQQSGMFMSMILIPVVLFLVMKCKRNGLNTLLVLKYQKRKNLFVEQMRESAFYAISISILIIGIQLPCTVFTNHTWCNWEKSSSVFFHRTGQNYHMSVGVFILIFIAILLMHILKNFILFVLIDIVSWFHGKLFLIYILVMIPVAILHIKQVDIFYGYFGTWQQMLIEPMEYGKRVLVGVGICILEYLVGILLVRKRDIFH